MNASDDVMGFAIIGRAFARPVGSTHPTLQRCASFRFAEKRMTAASSARLAAPQRLRHDCGNANKGCECNAACREVLMKRVLSGVVAATLGFAAQAVWAPTKPPFKLRGILDLSWHSGRKPRVGSD